MRAGRQTTLRDQTVLSGVGVHSGQTVSVTLQPADASTGIRFIRTGLKGRDREICANIHSVTATEFATVLGDASGPLVSTAEHVLAALRGLGVDNAVVEIDGAEMPIMDGLAAAEKIAGARLAPVVILTAFSQRDLVERARAAGAMAYLVKPFQKIDMTSTGKLHDAAMAKASPTMKATFWFSNMMPRMIASTPRNRVAIFETRISSCSLALPSLITMA